MKPASYRCKICGCERVAHADDECDPGQVAQLAKLLTCDHCFDLRIRRNEVIERIRQAAVRWLVHVETDSEVSVEDRTAVVAILQVGLKDFARVIADKHNTRPADVDPEVVDHILAKPRLVYTILGVFEHYCAHTPKPRELESVV